jgi:hypothetical protein
VSVIVTVNVEVPNGVFAGGVPVTEPFALRVSQAGMPCAEKVFVPTTPETTGAALVTAAAPMSKVVVAGGVIARAAKTSR